MDQFHQQFILDIPNSLLLQGIAFFLVFALILLLGTNIPKTEYLALNWEKQLRVLAHFCRHFVQQAIEVFEAAVCSRDCEPKERSLVEGLGAISHVLCVVVAGRTQLFITLRQQLLKSTLSPRLIRQQSHLTPAHDGVESSRKDSARCPSRFDTRKSPTSSGSRARSVTTGPGTAWSDGNQSSLRKCRSEVVISSSPRSLRAQAQRKIVACFPRRETTDEIKHPDLDLDSRLRSVSSSLHIDLEGGGKKAVLLSSQRHKQLLRG